MLWFIPQARGGRVIPERVQAALEAKGLCVMNAADGRRWMTVFGDNVRMGRVAVVVKG